MVAVLHSLAWYLWCRWTDHLGAPWYLTEMTREDDRTQVIAFSSCGLCHRVDPEDLYNALSKLERDELQQVLAELDITGAYEQEREARG